MIEQDRPAAPGAGRTLPVVSRLFVALGATMGAVSVAGAAWAAHAAAGGWSAEILTVAFGQLGLHGVAVLAWGLGHDRLGRPRLGTAAGILLAGGALAFAGALIVAAGGGSLGPVAPTGGLAMIAGWLTAAATAWPRR